MTSEGGQPAERGVTPSQTVGPFFAYALTPRGYDFPELATNMLATPDAVGERIRIEGRIIDGAGEAIRDAMVEIWQADGAGRHPAGSDGRNSAFSGFGRADIGPDGLYVFETVKPGPVAAPGGGMQAPHVDVGLFARGLLKRLFTRIYFADEPANAADAVLGLVPERRRPSLIASGGRDEDGVLVYRFDIRLQGEGETVFFAA